MPYIRQMAVFQVLEIFVGVVSIGWVFCMGLAGLVCTVVCHILDCTDISDTIPLTDRRTDRRHVRHSVSHTLAVTCGVVHQHNIIL